VSIKLISRRIFDGSNAPPLASTTPIPPTPQSPPDLAPLRSVHYISSSYIARNEPCVRVRAAIIVMSRTCIIRRSFLRRARLIISGRDFRVVASRVARARARAYLIYALDLLVNEARSPSDELILPFFLVHEEGFALYSSHQPPIREAQKKFE